MRKQRKCEAEERQCQIAQTIRYILWGLITVTSLGGLSLLYFFPEFLRGFKKAKNVLSDPSFSGYRFRVDLFRRLQ